MRLSGAVLLQGSDWIGSVMEIAAGEEARSGPVADALQGGSVG